MELLEPFTIQHILASGFPYAQSILGGIVLGGWAARPLLRNWNRQHTTLWHRAHIRQLTRLLRTLKCTRCYGRESSALQNPISGVCISAKYKSHNAENSPETYGFLYGHCSIIDCGKSGMSHTNSSYSTTALLATKNLIPRNSRNPSPRSSIQKMSPMRIYSRRVTMKYQVYNHEGGHKVSPSRNKLDTYIRIAEVQVRNWTISQPR